MMSFLRDCHSKVYEFFDNSPNVPVEILEKYSRLLDTKQLKSEWETYLRYKFSYLLKLEKNPDSSESDIKSEMRQEDKAYLAEFISKWRKNAEKERIAYMYRFVQLPKDVVHQRWYPKEEARFNEWCANRQKEIMRLEVSNSDSKTRQTILNDIYEKLKKKSGSYIALEPEDEFKLEFICKRLLQAHCQVSKEITLIPAQDTLGLCSSKCQEDLKHITDISNIRQSGEDLSDYVPLKKSQKDLSIVLTQSLYEELFDETRIIRRFLLELKERYPCEVCDYLDVSAEVPKILWRIATTSEEDLSEDYKRLALDELRKEIQKYESYSTGEGISGGVLLVTKNSWDIWHHIGSNDVVNDPRQSIEHATAYKEKMYPNVLKATGDINNFWAFPIFHGSKLVGVFRVVNKLTTDRTIMPNGWNYCTRVELSLIAQWFSEFLTSIQPLIEYRTESLAIFEEDRKIKELINKLKLDKVNERNFRGLLRHLMRDVTKKEEERGIGCCIIIADVTRGQNALDYLGLEPHLLLKPDLDDMQYPYTGIDLYHDVVDALEGAYVFDYDGNFHGIANLSLKIDGEHQSGLGAVESLTKKHEKTFCLFLAKDTKIIRIYKSKSIAAEIFLSERSGFWTYRYPTEICEKIKEHGKCDDETSDIIFRTCLDLSYLGFGSTIIIGDLNAEDLEENFEFKFTKPKKYDVGRSVKDVGARVFREIIKSEGATFLRRRDGGIIKLNVLITSIKKMIDFSKRQHPFPSKGGRHDAAWRTSLVVPDALVIVISKNRTINLLVNGNLVYQED